MKRRNRTLIVMSIIALTWFILSRTVWGPPNKAAASETTAPAVAATTDQHDISDAERRYLNNQPRHWRQVMLRQN